jgi:hypothetical protein
MGWRTTGSAYWVVSFTLNASPAFSARFSSHATFGLPYVETITVNGTVYDVITNFSSSRAL